MLAFSAGLIPRKSNLLEGSTSLVGSHWPTSKSFSSQKEKIMSVKIANHIRSALLC